MRAGGTMKGSAPAYLGDGVYAEHDGWALVLTTSDGMSVTNRIVLESEVYATLLRYVASLNDRNRKATKGETP
jgi:hypothetical protein